MLDMSINHHTNLSLGSFFHIAHDTWCAAPTALSLRGPALDDSERRSSAVPGPREGSQWDFFEGFANWIAWSWWLRSLSAAGVEYRTV